MLSRSGANPQFAAQYLRLGSSVINYLVVVVGVVDSVHKRDLSRNLRRFCCGLSVNVTCTFTGLSVDGFV